MSKIVWFSSGYILASLTQSSAIAIINNITSADLCKGSYYIVIVLSEIFLAHLGW